jgi:hypothetical protein
MATAEEQKKKMMLEVVTPYQVFYEGKPDTTTDDLDEMFKPMTVTEINYIGIGDFSGGLN